MKFSILLSLYYKEKPEYLEKCFESIWHNQTLKPTEIVLVLDGAIGSELSACVTAWQAMLNETLKVIALPENLGLGKALNEGLKYCTNEWVFRMDTDDICTEDRFAKQVGFIESYPNIVLFGGQILEFNQDISDAHVLKAVPKNHNDIKVFAQKRCPFNHMTVAYQRDAIIKLGGYQHHLFMEDYNLWLRVIAAGYEVANLPDVILYARVGNGMYTRRKGLEYIKSEKKLLDLKKELKLQHPFYANMLFLIRSMFRLLPSTLLGKIYNNFLRKRV
ncbi:glycosyltransferase [Acinetobacter sp. VNK23]|uniref:glycosyltransferase n=1 Tax=Acinetobacter thutiue TaxID=2998078 RepID=UPI002578888A|nr:glycosyltransferase [Acinetobacter thutiue]MDM1021927.1 glycosyltransferase [Acinetobacter thutiue]